MAAIRLGKHTSEEDDLPEVCMRCGAPATVHKLKKFSWHPQWVLVLILVALLVYVIVAVVLTKRQVVCVPLCDRHRNHWLGRQLTLLLSFLGLVGMGVGATALLANTGPGGQDMGGFLCLGWVGGLLAWAVLAVILQNTSIRPTEITDRSITLTGVAPEFVTACEDDWDRRHDLDRVAREHWNGSRRRADRYREEDEDEEPRRPDTYQRGE